MASVWLVRGTKRQEMIEKEKDFMLFGLRVSIISSAVMQVFWILPAMALHAPKLDLPGDAQMVFAQPSYWFS